MSQQAKWYVVHTYSGHENKVKVNIEKMVENRGMEDVVLEVKVPTEEKSRLKMAKKSKRSQNYFQGMSL
jgi:transcription termination/antitermination protein NusG